jgi:hypothetical protein
MMWKHFKVNNFIGRPAAGETVEPGTSATMLRYNIKDSSGFCEIGNQFPSVIKYTSCIRELKCVKFA